MTSPAADRPFYTPAPPLDGFSAEAFRERRARLRAAFPEAIVLLQGAAAGGHGDASGGEMLFYFTGVDTPEAYLALLPEGVPARAGVRGAADGIHDILFLPARRPAAELWNGAELGPGAETEAATGIDRVVDSAGLWQAMAGWLSRRPVAGIAAPWGPGAGATRGGALIEKMRDAAPIASFVDITRAANSLRTVKSAEEIARIRRAAAITADAHRAAAHAIAHGARGEYDIEAVVFRTFRAAEAACAFPTIVGAGANGTILHYGANRGSIEAGQLVVVDIGAKLGHYCGDLTRTYPAGGNFTERGRAIYDFVAQIHRDIVASFRPGEDSLSRLNERCTEMLKASSLEASDIDGAPAPIASFMPHSLGHHLGLEVHDPGDGDAILQPGCVITIEPGIYIPYEAIGVRLEDDYLVTEQGLESLTPGLPLESAALLEAIRPAG